MTKRKGPSTFAEEQANFAAEQIDLLTNLGENLLEALQGGSADFSAIAQRADCWP